MGNIEVLDGFRYKSDYYGLNLYMIITPKSLDINLENRDAKNRTLVGTGIIGSLVTLLLDEYDADYERVAGAIWENSMSKGDLADILSLAIVEGNSHLKQEETI
jgi:hypothetical protein